MSNSVCMLHTDRPTTATCAECSRPLCPECTQLVADKPVCQTCLTAIRSRVATQLNAEAASARTAQPLPPQAPTAPYGSSSGAFPPVVAPPPAAPPYGATRTDLAGNAYTPPPGSQYPPQQPYGAPQNPAYPPQQPTPGYNPQAPSGAQPGYGAAPPPPYGQHPGYGQPQPPATPGQPAYNPYGTAQQPYPPQQTGSPNAQAPYGAPPQPYPNHNPYGVQAGRPQTPPAPTITAGNYILGIVFGLITAVIGAVIYIALIETTHMMIGYMALGIGFLVGWAVKMGARFPSQGAGIVAVVLTILAILPGQLLYSRDGSGILFTALFLFIGSRWAYRIAATGHFK